MFFRDDFFQREVVSLFRLPFSGHVDSTGGHGMFRGKCNLSARCFRQCTGHLNCSFLFDQLFFHFLAFFCGLLLPLVVLFLESTINIKTTFDAIDFCFDNCLGFRFVVFGEFVAVLWENNTLNLEGPLAVDNDGINQKAKEERMHNTTKVIVR